MTPESRGPATLAALLSTIALLASPIAVAPAAAREAATAPRAAVPAEPVSPPQAVDAPPLDRSTETTGTTGAASIRAIGEHNPAAGAIVDPAGVIGSPVRRAQSEPAGGRDTERSDPSGRAGSAAAVGSTPAR
ncbi:MAG TPA: hypothetical protein VM491_20075 [Burkholderiaceae bacterium]|nr:hypothetical protein [Burkholderiaceae bacterium]